MKIAVNTGWLCLSEGPASRVSPGHSAGHVLRMKNKYLYLALSIICLLIGIFGGSALEGGFKGLAGVFFIIFYILTLLGKQPTDKTTH